MRTDKSVKFLGLNLVKWLKTLPLVTILLGMRERGCIKIRAKTNVLLGFNAFRLRLSAENIGFKDAHQSFAEKYDLQIFYLKRCSIF